MGLEDNATAKLLLFEDSGNDLIPSDSGLCGSNMGTHGKTKKPSQWFCQKAVFFSMQGCVTQNITSYNTRTFSLCLVKISIICLQQFRRNLYFGIMMKNKHIA
jgi:hypothetical protein